MPSKFEFQFDCLSETVSCLGVQLIRRIAVSHQSRDLQTPLRPRAEALGVIHDAPCLDLTEQIAAQVSPKGRWLRTLLPLYGPKTF
jgi:hypothetical protein